jgi:outer membrane protein TolC
MPKVLAGAVLSVLMMATIAGLPAAETPDAELQRLLQERIAILTKMSEFASAAHRQGAMSLSEVLESRRMLLSAKLDGAESKAERVKVLEEIVKLAEQTQAMTEQRAKSAEVSQLQVLKAKADVLEVKIKLQREKAAP